MLPRTDTWALIPGNIRSWKAKRICRCYRGQCRRSGRSDSSGKGQIETVPDSQAVGGQRPPRTTAPTAKRQKRRHGQRGKNAHHQALADQNHHRQPHETRWLVRRKLGQIDRLAVEKDVMDEADRIGHGKDAGQGRRRRQHPAAERPARSGAGFRQRTSPWTESR